MKDYSFNNWLSKRNKRDEAWNPGDERQFEWQKLWDEFTDAIAQVMTHVELSSPMQSVYRIRGLDVTPQAKQNLQRIYQMFEPIIDLVNKADSGGLGNNPSGRQFYQGPEAKQVLDF